MGQLGMIVVGFADNVMVGHYSTAALASASFVNNVFNMVLFGCLGFTYGITPLLGAMFSRGKHQEIGSSVRRALKLNLLFSLLVTLVMTVLYFYIEKLGQPDELLPVIRPYYLLYLSGIIPVALTGVMVQWSYAIGNTRMPMWIMLAANALNIIGNYILIYGKYGAPELGLNGAGISTLASRLFALAVIVYIFFKKKHYKSYRQGFFSKMKTLSYKKIWDTSIPVAMQMTFESGSFTMAAIMAGVKSCSRWGTPL
ncbi:MAG: MATE family efflux transporter, partial [Muribaculaceae bacterium]